MSYSFTKESILRLQIIFDSSPDIADYLIKSGATGPSVLLVHFCFDNR